MIPTIWHKQEVYEAASALAPRRKHGSHDEWHTAGILRKGISGRPVFGVACVKGRAREGEREGESGTFIR